MMAISKRHSVGIHVLICNGKSFFSSHFNQEVIFPTRAMYCPLLCNKSLQNSMPYNNEKDAYEGQPERQSQPQKIIYDINYITFLAKQNYSNGENISGC